MPELDTELDGLIAELRRAAEALERAADAVAKQERQPTPATKRAAR